MNAPITNPSTRVYAGFWRRFAAWIIDYVTLLAAAVAVGMFLPSEDKRVGAFFFLVWLVYKVGMESSSMQATVGKLALGIKVTDADGQRIGIGRAVGRSLAMFLSGLSTVPRRTARSTDEHWRWCLQSMRKKTSFGFAAMQAFPPAMN